MRLTEIKITLMPYADPTVSFVVVQTQPGEMGQFCIAQNDIDALKEIAECMKRAVSAA